MLKRFWGLVLVVGIICSSTSAITVDEFIAEYNSAMTSLPDIQVEDEKDGSIFAFVQPDASTYLEFITEDDEISGVGVILRPAVSPDFETFIGALDLSASIVYSGLTEYERYGLIFQTMADFAKDGTIASEGASRQLLKSYEFVYTVDSSGTRIAIMFLR